MTLDKGVATGDLGKLRYERDLKLIEGLRDDKVAEKEKVVAERAAVEQAYRGMTELQQLIE